MVLLSNVFIACDPDVANEGINLPGIEFGLVLKPDSSFIKLGDTVTLKSSISNVLLNGVKITDGKAAINLYLGYTEQTPITTFGFTEVEKGNQSLILLKKGDIEYVDNGKKILNIYALPYSNDSFQIEISFIPLKKGTYCFQVQSMFYEGTKGKTRTNPKFQMFNHHFDALWEIDGDNYQSGDFGYDSRYLFAVTE